LQEQTIPVVDLKRFTDGDADDQRAFVSKLGQAIHEFGFVAVENHRLDRDALSETYDQLKRFFALPTALKGRYEDPSGGRQRGYTSFGKEHAKYHDVPDLKEFWHIGPELSEQHPLFARNQPNMWPIEVPSFKQPALKLWASLMGVSLVLLRALARYLDAEEAEFVRMVDGGNTILRLIHYPPPPSDAPEGAVWAAAHEDINLITLLAEATDAGLQLKQRNGEWLAIEPIPGQLIADSGDMLERLTNGLIPSTTHRVMQPKDVSNPRYSMPFFVHAQPDYVLTPLPNTVSDSHPRKWDDITAEEYLLERIREIGILSDPK
jgi:isopenicillin N synthase-like dioxygenase